MKARAAAFVLLAGSAALADDDAARRAKIALEAGSFSASVGEIEDRIAELPSFQVKEYGATREELVKAYVDQVIGRELLLVAGAEKRGLAEKYPTKQVRERTLSTATLRALRKDLKSPEAIPLADVQKFYDDNRTRFEQPERVNLWRILCKTREEATTVLAAAKKDLTIPKYNDLARDHSVDKATAFRGGNLGFVAPDGQSNEAGVRVDPGLVKAVANVKDGELAPEPIPEGPSWAVVWRRTTVAATKRSLEDATAQIRTTIYRERTEALEKKHIEELRKAKVTGYDPEPLKTIELPPFDAGLAPRVIPSATKR
ncbi:MAG: peptidyl-prolyl cis-trans isomerase [Labilithrix sp.]|nr:peptidyl-prolyl cis-trans isomerase [Labilithrix sp.]MCW5811742.1 peptidyl-prolyl cis-trans isomerase [Labilithrix sp.]